MIRSLACIPFLSLALLVWTGDARAAESYDNCTGFIDSIPAVISTQGTWCLRSDVSTGMSSGNAIEIATNNVTLDCNDFKIGGLAAGLSTSANGVFALDRTNIAVRNCRIRGFGFGISVGGLVGGHRIEDNTLEGSRYMGIVIRGAGSVVRGNRVIDSGGSTTRPHPFSVEVGINVASGVDVIDNRVSIVRPVPGSGRSAAGIRSVNNEGGNIIGNRVSGLVTDGAANSSSILIHGAGAASRSIVSGNILKGSGSPENHDIAIQCTGFPSDAISIDNVITGFDAAVSGCSAGDNSVNDN